jgi:hypothetical protein
VHESAGICLYLADRYGYGKLCPCLENHQDRALCNQWLTFSTGSLECVVARMFTHVGTPEEKAVTHASCSHTRSGTLAYGWKSTDPKLYETPHGTSCRGAGEGILRIGRAGMQECYTDWCAFDLEQNMIERRSFSRSSAFILLIETDNDPTEPGLNSFAGAI